MNSDSDSDSDLDIDWIKDQERIIHIEKKNYREPMTSISIRYIYINTDSEIEEVLHEKIPLSIESGEKNRSFLTKETLLKLILLKKKSTFFKKYIFMDMLLYNIDLESDHIQKYIREPGSPSFLKNVPIPEDIYFEPSLFIFHSLNTIYIFFKEVEKKLVLNPKPCIIIDDHLFPQSTLMIGKKGSKKKQLSYNNTTRKNINN